MKRAHRTLSHDKPPYHTDDTFFCKKPINHLGYRSRFLQYRRTPGPARPCPRTTPRKFSWDFPVHGSPRKTRRFRGKDNLHRVTSNRVNGVVWIKSPWLLRGSVWLMYCLIEELSTSVRVELFDLELINYQRVQRILWSFGVFILKVKLK